MKTKAITITNEDTVTFTKEISDGIASAIEALANTPEPVNAPSVELVWDSPDGSPPQRPYLTLRVSGDNQPAGCSFTLEVLTSNAAWEVIGVVEPGTATTLDVGQNGQAVRCIVANIAGSATGEPLSLN